MRAFGLTGGIGMGKSTCAGLLLKHGVLVVDTDDLARQLVEPGKPALAQIVTAFGPAVLDASQSLRRDVLADFVFSDSAARKKLEAILHPEITRAWVAQLARWRVQGIASVVVVIPLLFETQAESQFDATVCVACSPGTQKVRLCKRGWSQEEIMRRSDAQLPVEQKMAQANHVIWTEGSVASLAEQAKRVFGLS
jgi:dephospho-CoA kinase